MHIKDKLTAVSKMLRREVLENGVPTSAISIANAIQQQRLQLPFKRKAFDVAALLLFAKMAMTKLVTMWCPATVGHGA